MKKGFTLVELAIVLVIIGLLIGSILAAQSMIETTRVQSFVRQIDQEDIAVANFENKYHGLPGDMATFGCVSASGLVCDDGNISAPLGGGTPRFIFSNEVANYWENLTYTELPTKTYSHTLQGGVIQPEINVPSTPFGKAGLVVSTGTIGGLSSYFYNKLTYKFALFKGSAYEAVVYGSGPQLGPAAAITGAQALAIDTKMDDGIANTGDVQASPYGLASCNTAGVYNVNLGSTNICWLYITAMAHSGTQN